MSKDRNGPYSPMKALGRARRAMDSTVRKSGAQPPGPLSLSSNSGAVPCAVLLKSFIENGPVPDDFQGLPRTSQALKDHVRSDGAVYLGAFELQGDRSSVVLMYGQKGMDPEKAEKMATLERPALINRHTAAALGPFAAKPVVTTPPLTPRLA